MTINNVLGIEVKRRLQDIKDLQKLSTEAQQRSLTAEEKARLAELASTLTREQLKAALDEGDQLQEVLMLRVDPETQETFDTAADMFAANQRKVSSQLTKVTSDVISRGINALYPPAPYQACVGDGVADDTVALNTLIDNFYPVILPFNHTFRVTDTIKLGPRWRSLIGPAPIGDDDNFIHKVPRIVYDGEIDHYKTVIQLGNNEVGAEPILDSSGIILKDIYIDANHKAGFSVYGTYLTNESQVSGVRTKNSLEYNYYFAKAWYATIRDIVSIDCRGQGIALGMPLEFLDGNPVTWTSPANLEMNNCEIGNIRSIRAGKYFSVDNSGVFNPEDPGLRRKAYGIGFGYGNSFNVDRYTSEQSGGVAVYVLNGSQPVKNIFKGYIERTCFNSGLDSTTKLCGYIIENTSSSGSSVVIDTAFVSHTNGGGIYFTGTIGRKVWLKNMFQPRFLKSLDGLTDMELYAEVLKDKVYYDCGFYNTDPGGFYMESSRTVNTRESFRINILPKNQPKMIFIYAPNGGHGSVTVNFDDGTSTSFPIPTTDKLEYVRDVRGNAVSVTKGGGTGDGTTRNIEIAVADTKPTWY